MQQAVVSPWTMSPALSQTHAAALNERLALALASSHQIAFDWHIPDDLLHFDGKLEGDMKGTLLDVTRIWKSRDLSSLIHEDDRQQFQARLHDALKGNAISEDAYYRVELRLQDTFRGWRWISIHGKIVERDIYGRAVRMVGTFSDIDERKHRERDLADKERITGAILTAAIDCIVTVNDRGEIISFNSAAEQTFGYRERDVLGKRLRDMIVQPHTEGTNAFETEFPLNARIELSAIRSDGSLFPAELAFVQLPVQESRVFAAFIRDISDRKRTENLQIGQNRILDMVASGTPLPDILAEIRRFAETQSGTSCIISQLDTDSDAAGTTLLQTGCREIRVDGGIATGISRPILGKCGKLFGILTLHRNASVDMHAEDVANVCAYLAGLAIESRLSEERIRYLAHYDALTTLPNRFLFKEYFDLALKSAKRHGKKFAVLFVDLDKFKEVNDTLGHDAGDEVLRVVARRLRSCLRHTDKIARMGGDEFYVLIEDLNNGHHAAEVAGKLLEEASRPVRIGDAECRISASIGISIYPDDGTSEQALLKQADSAMYKAKDSGKNAYEFFSSDTKRLHAESAVAARNAVLAAKMLGIACHE